jgi:hypothetical protein
MCGASARAACCGEWPLTIRFAGLRSTPSEPGGRRLIRRASSAFGTRFRSQKGPHALAVAAQVGQCLNQDAGGGGIPLWRDAANVIHDHAGSQAVCHLQRSPRPFQAGLQGVFDVVPPARAEADRGNPQTQIIQHFPHFAQTRL